MHLETWFIQAWCMFVDVCLLYTSFSQVVWTSITKDLWDLTNKSKFKTSHHCFYICSKVVQMLVISSLKITFVSLVKLFMLDKVFQNFYENAEHLSDDQFLYIWLSKYMFIRIKYVATLFIITLSQEAYL